MNLISYGRLGVAADSAGNVYVADTYNHTIRKVTPAGAVTTLAGLSQDTNGAGFPDVDYADGKGNAARFSFPFGVAVDSAGNVYVADSSNKTIRKGYAALMVFNSRFSGGQFGFNLTCSNRSPFPG